MLLHILFFFLFYASSHYAMDVPSQTATLEVNAEQRKTLFGYIYKGWEGFFERKLDSEKIPVDTCDERGSTLLHVAAEQAQPKIVRILLARGASVHAVSEYTTSTPLYGAVTCNPNAPEVVEQLLVHGADPFCKNKHYKLTPLYLAAVGGYIPIVRLILTKSRFAVDHTLAADECLDDGVNRISFQRMQNGKKLLAMQDPINTCTALQKVEIDLRVLSEKQKVFELHDFEVERMNNFRTLLPLLLVDVFEKNFERAIQDDVRKILVESQKKHK